MSVQQALLFLNAVRKDEALRSGLSARQDDIGLDDLLVIARDRGFSFDTPDLREAFRHDWALRALRRQNGDVAPTGRSREV